MKKLPFIITIIILFPLLSFAQINEIIVDEKLEKEILIGKCNRAGLQLPELGDWYKLEYETYLLKNRIIKKLKAKVTDDISITIVLATWCHDSRREVPRFCKILDLVGVDDNNVLMYSTDLNKIVKGKDISNLDIQRVPTFIIYRNGTEIGRIIESPKRSLEKDLLKILNPPSRSLWRTRR